MGGYFRKAFKALSAIVPTRSVGSRGRYKRPLDLAVLIVSHVLLAPFLLLLWSVIPMAVWLGDRGTVFYRQNRMGKDGRVFTILKFRTMVADAEKATGPVWAIPNDRRVTWIGNLLRCTALDELPQTISIWKGDMSLVGPRSERPELHQRFAQEVPAWEKRLQVRPGLTGLAQVKGKYNLPPAEKLRYDLEYIRRMNVFLDLKLLVLSLLNTLGGRWDRPAL
jgi:lipopolysaccharide/colanic/teichoic acid biosynthesis glycosyltransferase